MVNYLDLVNSDRTGISCNRCGTELIMGVNWNEGRKSQAVYRCRHCEAELNREINKKQMYVTVNTFLKNILYTNQESINLLVTQLLLHYKKMSV